MASGDSLPVNCLSQPVTDSSVDFIYTKGMMQGVGWYHGTYIYKEGNSSLELASLLPRGLRVSCDGVEDRLGAWGCTAQTQVLRLGGRDFYLLSHPPASSLTTLNTFLLASTSHP